MYRESLVGAVRLDAHCDHGLLQPLFLIELVANKSISGLRHKSSKNFD